MQLMAKNPTQRVYRPPTAYLWPYVGDILSCGSPLETIAESSDEDNEEDKEDNRETTKEKEEFYPHLLSGDGDKEKDKAKSP